MIRSCTAGLTLEIRDTKRHRNRNGIEFPGLSPAPGERVVPLPPWAMASIAKDVPVPTTALVQVGLMVLAEWYTDALTGTCHRRCRRDPTPRLGKETGKTGQTGGLGSLPLEGACRREIERKAPRGRGDFRPPSSLQAVLLNFVEQLPAADAQQACRLRAI